MAEILNYLRQYFLDKVFSIAYLENVNLEKRLERLARKSEEQFLDGPGGCFMAMIGTETVTNIPKFNEIITGFFVDWKHAFVHLYSQAGIQKQASKIFKKTNCSTLHYISGRKTN